MRISDYKNEDEDILWTGKPNKSVFIKEQIFSPFFLFALFWFLADLAFIISMVSFVGSNIGFPIPILVVFFIIHLTPVWAYLYGVITSIRRWKNLEYMITDKAIYEVSGVASITCNRKTFDEITNVSVHQGKIDKRHDVGDIYIITGYTTTNKGNLIKQGINIVNIDNYMAIYRMIIGFQEK